jgi:hypothetical protein
MGLPWLDTAGTLGTSRPRKRAMMTSRGAGSKMDRRHKLSGLRLGFTYGAGLGLLVAMISAPAASAPADMARALPAIPARTPVSAPGAASIQPTVILVNGVPLNLSAANAGLPNNGQESGGLAGSAAPVGAAGHVSRRVFSFTPVPGHELPALVLPPPGTRGLFIAAHADRAELVSSPRR